MGTSDREPHTALACPDSGDLLIDRIASMRAWLTGLDAADLGDRDRIRVVAAIEELTGSAAGTQARMTAAYADSQRALGCSARGVAAEIGLARRVGLSRASVLVSAARMLVEDLPETMGHLEDGRLSEQRAVTVAGRLACVEPLERQEVDARLAADLPRLGDAEVRDAVDAAVMTIDPQAVEARRLAACRQRRVTVRPAADGMAWLGIHTTAVDAAAALNTLRAHADSVVSGAGGLNDLPEDAEGRGHGEIMADAALARLTGRSVHEGPPVELQLVMSDSGLAAVAGEMADDGGGGGPESGSGRGGSGPGGDGPADSGSGRDGSGNSGEGLNGGASRGGGRERRPGAAVARVVGVGPVPIGVARELLVHAPTGLPTTRSGPSPTHDQDPVEGAVSETGPFRMFEGPDWELDDRTPEQRHREAARDRARWRLDGREATRVAIRRVHLSRDGRNPIAVDARRRLMPAAARDPSRSDDPEVRDWFARLRAPAIPGELATLTSSQRCARGLLRLMVVLRDQRCRVPWCTAPIRHVDHVEPHRDRPVTDAAGLAGDCAGHNLAKEDPGHTVAVTHDGHRLAVQPHTVAWTTPTGHTYEGVAPPVLGWGNVNAPAHITPAVETAAAPDDSPSPLEAHLAALLAA